MRQSISTTATTVSIETTEINKDAKDLCDHFKQETGDIYYQSDVENMIADLLSDCFETIAVELPRLLKDGSGNPKTIDLSLILKRAKNQLIAVDNDDIRHVA